MKFLHLLLLSVLIPFSMTAKSQSQTLKDNSPVVVSSIPSGCSKKVDPTVSKIEIQFSKPMKTNKMWSVVLVKPEANTVYEFSVNWASDTSKESPHSHT